MADRHRATGKFTCHVTVKVDVDGFEGYGDTPTEAIDNLRERVLEHLGEPFPAVRVEGVRDWTVYEQFIEKESISVVDLEAAS